MTSSNRPFDPDEPDRLWVMDVTEHPTGDGKVYLAVVLDAFSRRVVGWSIADHIRSELVVDAVQMAIWRRRPPDGQTIAHSDHGSQYTSWAFGRRLRAAGPARLDGLDRRLLRQQRRRELLRHPATRAPRRAPLGHPRPARPRDLRLDRSLVQPAPPPQLLRHAQPHRLRDRQPRHDHHNQPASSRHHRRGQWLRPTIRGSTNRASRDLSAGSSPATTHRTRRSSSPTGPPAGSSTISARRVWFSRRSGTPPRRRP